MEEITMPAWPETCVETAGPGSTSYAASSRPAHTVVLHEGTTEPASETPDMALATNVYGGGKHD